MKKVALYSFIFFLLLSALIAIISVISGAFGELKLKFLVTTSVVALTSICALASSTSQHHQIGTFGIILSVLAAVMLIAGGWLEVSNDLYWKASAALSVFSVAIAHFLALNQLRLLHFLSFCLKNERGLLKNTLNKQFASLILKPF